MDAGSLQSKKSLRRVKFALAFQSQRAKHFEIPIPRLFGIAFASGRQRKSLALSSSP
jgi:hypothetical protein